MRLLIFTRNQRPLSAAVIGLLNSLVLPSREQGCGMLLPSATASYLCHWGHDIGGKKKEGFALLIY